MINESLRELISSAQNTDSIYSSRNISNNSTSYPNNEQFGKQSFNELQLENIEINDSIDNAGITDISKFSIEYYELQEELGMIVLNYLIQQGYSSAAYAFAEEFGFVLNKTNSQLGNTIDSQKEVELENKNENKYKNEIENLNNNENENENDHDSGTEEELKLIDDWFEPSLILKNINETYNNIVENSSREFKFNIDKYQRVFTGLDSIEERFKIKKLILNGKIEDSIKLIIDKFPRLFEKNRFIWFKLLHLQLIEMIRNQMNDKSLDDQVFLELILKFIDEKLSDAKILQNKKFVRDMELTMALLCFDKGINIPNKLKRLLSLKMRNIVANLVNKSIIIYLYGVEGFDYGLSALEGKLENEKYKKKYKKKQLASDNTNSRVSVGIRRRSGVFLDTDIQRLRQSKAKDDLPIEEDSEGDEYEDSDEYENGDDDNEDIFFEGDSLNNSKDYTDVKLLELAKLMVWSYQCGDVKRLEKLLEFIMR